MCCCLQCFNGTVHCQIDRCVFVCCWQSYRKVELEPGSQEYDWVSAAFHETMSWPRAYILHIHRVQNLTLWQFYLVYVHTHTHTDVQRPFVRVKPVWILLKQETVSGSGISWAICKSEPRSRQITTPAPHRSVFYRPDALPAAQPTASKHWRQIWCK